MHGLACDSKTPGCLPFADSFHIHRAPHGCVEFHSVHLSVRPHHCGFLPGGSLFRRPEAALPRRSLVYFCSAAYTRGLGERPLLAPGRGWIEVSNREGIWLSAWSNQVGPQNTPLTSNSLKRRP